MAIFTKHITKTKHQAVIRNCCKKNIENIFVAAGFREIRRMVSIFELGGMKTKTVRRHRSLIQGDPAAPYVFNIVLDVAIKDFVRIYERKSRGTFLMLFFYPVLFFFGHFWIIPNSATHLAEMFDTWLEVWVQSGWSVPVGECTWCTTAADEADWVVKDKSSNTIRRAKRSDGFKPSAPGSPSTTPTRKRSSTESFSLGKPSDHTARCSLTRKTL